MRIAITGIGIVSALGVGKEANSAMLLAGVSSIHSPQILDTCHAEWLVGEVNLTNEQLKSRLGLSGSAVVSRTALLGMLAAKEAVDDAALAHHDIAKAAFINGTTVGGMDSTERVIPEWMRNDFTNIKIIEDHPAGQTTSQIANYIGGFAHTNTISTACSSALNALIVGVNMLRANEAHRVLVGGTESLSKFHLNGFGALGILSKKICKPFNDDRDGINLGEGAGYLILEREEEALQRGAHIYGYVAGYANRCDAFHSTASSPNGDGAYAAMTDALRMCNISPEMVDYINAHGTGTPNNDASEKAAIDRIFGNVGVHYESTKNLTGHTTSASGGIETIFCLMLMHERGYKCAMNNAFGFGGNDSSLVLTASPTELPAIANQAHTVRTYSVNVEDDIDYKQYITLMQARRLTPQMRRMVVAAKQALQQASIERPDAIIVGTNWGGMRPSMSLLTQLTEQDEQEFSPAQFTLSTHNSMAGTLAILLGATGYNCTISHGADSYTEAMTDGLMQIKTHNARTVLVCEFDETVEPWQSYLTKAGIPSQNRAKAIVLCGDY